jgi:GGDEF domain-containing protein
MPSIDFAQIEIERAHYDNLFDPISGLPTGWMLLFDRLEMALARSRRTGYVVAVFVLDRPRLLSEERIDFGYAVQSLRRQLRDDDTLAKIGEDRLVIVCADIVDDAEAATFARRIVHDSGVTCSLGVALSSAGDSSSLLLARAVAAATREFEDEPQASVG